MWIINWLEYEGGIVYWYMFESLFDLSFWLIGEILIYMVYIAWLLFGDDLIYKGFFEIFLEFYFCFVRKLLCYKLVVFIICVLKLDWNLNIFLKEKFCRLL